MMTHEITIMNEIHHHDSDFKLKFLGYGEWVEEPDSVIFTYRDFACNIIRIILREPYSDEEAYFGGHLCGYVAIPPTHFLYEKDYDKGDDLNFIECHGGITFSEFSAQNKWLIGFDCGHSGDYVPTMEMIKKQSKFSHLIRVPDYIRNSVLFNPTYKNIQYCIDECRSMVDQIIEKSESLSNENK
jgi:hypothetical protein